MDIPQLDLPRDLDFERKAGPILDLYRGRWQGEPLRPDEHVVCADEKTSIQARARIHPGCPPAPGRAGRVEHEYKRTKPAARTLPRIRTVRRVAASLTVLVLAGGGLDGTDRSGMGKIA